MQFVLEPPYSYLLLVVVGFITSIINTIAGGGSMLTLPILIFIGLPPTVANGTNRLGILSQSISSAFGFKSKSVSILPLGKKVSFYILISIVIGAALGARIAVYMDDRVFTKVLAILIPLIILMIVFQPKSKKSSSLETNSTSTPKIILTTLIYFCIGVYAGFIQAGTGFMIIASLSFLFHLNLVAINAAKTIIVLFIISIALSIFVYYQQVHYGYGLALAVGNGIGGWWASRWSVKKGEGIIKIALVIMASLMAIKLWFDS